MKVVASLAPAAFLILAACAGSNDESAPRTVWVADGPPTSCISTMQIRSMRVVDDRTIDFEMTGRRVYRNNLPVRCPGLGFNTAVRHNSRTSQLCSMNSITPRAPGGGWSRAGCPLGQFQPLVRAPVPPAPAAG
jgi:hypothetical protein